MCLFPFYVKKSEKLYKILLTILFLLSRLGTVFSRRLRKELMVSWAPSLPASVLDQLSTILQFGDWLILTMMADHLDIKLTTDILNKIKAVNYEVKRHSSISTTLEVLGTSDNDTDGETEEKSILKSPPVTPGSTRRLHPPIIKKVKCSHLSWSIQPSFRVPQQQTWSNSWASTMTW